ncbi:glycosyltransferase [Pseudoalteromonas sp. S4492]|uniref:glycosyltransferase n=1 Tax=Pseudoalteromonas sp. S4492 TaxID=579560 RepID=UPI0014863D24|nr:glycosyltransferase [Pseudoalteromonas sp. S4492]
MGSKILLLLTRSPLPASGGREMMLMQAIHMISDMGAKIDIAFFTKDGSVSSQKLKLELEEGGIFADKIVPLSYAGMFTAALRGVVSNKPMQNALFYTKSNVNILTQLELENNYDIVYFDMLRTAQYASLFPHSRTVLDLDDLLSVRYRRVLSQGIKEFNALGTFSRFFESTFTKKLLNFTINIALSIEAKRLHKAERLALEKFNAVGLVSPLEAKELSYDTKKEVIPLPPILEIKNVTSSSVKNDIVFAFVGNLATNQNYQSLMVIINDYLPVLFSEYPTSTFIVIGNTRGVDLNIVPKEYCERVTFKGFVDNLQSEYETIDFALCPIKFGTGIKLKIIEAIANNTPVLTNDIGAEGIGIENFTMGSISNLVSGHFSFIDKCIEDDNFYDEVKVTSKNYLKSSFSSEVVKYNFRKFLLG